MNTNIQQTGSIGEHMVLDYLKETGEYSSVNLSDNVYDMHKDILAETANTNSKIQVECKVRTVIRKYYAMPLERSQWYKADNCDKLFFISNPTNTLEAVSIYESNKNDFFVVDNFGPRNTETRMYDLNKMKLVKTIANPAIIKQLYDLSISSYKQ